MLALLVVAITLAAGCQDRPIGAGDEPTSTNSPGGNMPASTPDEDAPASIPQSPTSETIPTPQVKLETSLGDIVLELDEERAPITVLNFLQYVDDGFYDGTISHRVEPLFIIQGGARNIDMVEKIDVRDPIMLEADNGLKHLRGTIAMARRAGPDTATSEFFINLSDNMGLDARDDGFTVFGRVVEGMDTVDTIEGTPLSTHIDYNNGAGRPVVPVTPVVINLATVLAGSDRIEQASPVEDDPDADAGGTVLSLRSDTGCNVQGSDSSGCQVLGSAQTVEGGVVQPTIQDGRVLLLNFVAANDHFGRTQIPRVESVRAFADSSEVRIVHFIETLRTRFTPEEALETLDEFIVGAVQEEIIYDPDNVIGRAFHVFAYPTLLVIDDFGIVRIVIRGDDDEIPQTLQGLIQRLIIP